MKVVTYLSITLLSIGIQFAVMDFIQAQMRMNHKTVGNIDLNNTSQKKSFIDIMEQYSQSPHALYYQAPNYKLVDKTAAKKETQTYRNSSIENISLEISTTELSSTVLDLLYDENTTVTEDSYTTATESMYTTTEFDFDNVTEITFFNKNNSNLKPKIMPKKTVSKDCSCNLLFKVCDINCCCDGDCTENEYKMFMCDKSALEGKSDTCLSQFSFLMGTNIDELFCVVKNNLPDKRNIIHNKHDPSTLQTHFQWHSNRNLHGVQEFTKKMYKHGDPIWLLRNGTIYYVDLPAPMVNNYCKQRKPLKFMKDEKFKCIVKLPDLEIFQILSTADQTSVISVNEQSTNTSILNCSTLHCTNWTIIFCDELTCMNYNKSLHDPICTDNICSNLSLKIAYTFHYYENKIMNATIQLYSQKVPLNIPFIEQEVSVRFVIANQSVHDIIEYSGNPGYITGLPLIVSHTKTNHSESFFNSTSKMKKYLSYPENRDGICRKSNFSGNFVNFMANTRIQCRFVQEEKVTQHNETMICKSIHRKITALLGFDQDIVISPSGNPYGLSDGDWIPLKIAKFDDVIYGAMNGQKTKLHCYNMIRRYSFLFSFADVSEKPTKTEFKILSANVKITTSNVTFNAEDVSTVVTLDTIFIDETKPSVYEYAGGPHLNINLPADFFFPFHSHGVNLFMSCNTFSLVLIIIFVQLIK